MWHQMRVRLDLVFACSPQSSPLLPNAPQWRKQWLGGASLEKSHCAPGLCAPILCCVLPQRVVCTPTGLCAPTLCCVHPYWTVCSHIVLCESLLDCVHPYFVVCIQVVLCAPLLDSVHPHSIFAPMVVLLCGPISYLLRRIKQILSNQTY